MTKRKSKDNDIIVSSLGNSTDNVTGSCFSISYPKDDNTRGLIILECGLSQDGHTPLEQYNSNKKMIDNISKEVIKNTEYVIFTHTHVDHVGNLSIFNSDNGFNGKILSTKKSIELSKELIKDSVYIHKKNLEYLKSKGKRLKPFYTEQQMYNMFEKMKSIEVGKEIVLNENLTIILNNNSHCLGSCNITLRFRKPNNHIKTIIYSGDLGSQINRNFSYYLEDQNIPKKCNMFISEATYCDKDRQMTKKQAIQDREELRILIKQAILEGRRILFPTFAFSRSQQLLTMFYEWFKDEEWFKNIPIVCDGVLINNINSTYLKILEDENKELFTNVMNWDNVKINKNYDGTVALLSKKTCGIYIASSGFLENGRVVDYLLQFIPSSKDIIVLTGYCGGEGSFGSKLLNNNQKTITLEKHVLQKRCKVIQYLSFSSHISHDELLKLWNELNCDKIFVHHSGNKKLEFIDEAKNYLKDRNKTTKIIPISKSSNQFIL